MVTLLESRPAIKYCLLLIGLCLLSVSAAQGATNLLANPGFDTLSGGVPTGWNISNPGALTFLVEGRSGPCVKFSSGSPTESQSSVSQSVGVIGGREYKLSLWIKTEGVASTGSSMGASIAWIRDGHIMQYDYLAGPTGTTPWTEYSQVLTAPSVATSMSVSIYVPAGTSGTAWIDDTSFTLTNRPKLTTTLIAPNYRKIMYGEYPANIVVQATVCADDGTFTLPEVQLTTRLIRKADSVTVASNTFAVTGEENTLSIPLPALASGDYTLNVYLKKTFNIASQQYTLTKIAASKPPAVSWFDKDNRLIFNGEPYFPVGTYTCVNDAESDLSTIADAGYNAVMPYWRFQKSINEQNALLAFSENLGVKTIYSLKDMYEILGWSGASTAVTNNVNAFKSNPNILAWYLADEPGPTSEWISDLQSQYNLVSSLDSNHPCWIVDFRPENLRKFLDGFDVSGVDYYPIAWIPAYWCGLAQGLANSYIYNSRPAWGVPQIFNFECYQPGQQWERPPTAAEMRNMAYQFICAGVTGLVLYSHDDLHRDPDATFAQRWADVKPLVRELRSLAPVYISNEAPLSVSVTGSGFSYITKAYMGDTYVFLVNPYTSSTTATVTLPGGGYTVFVDGSIVKPDSQNRVSVSLAAMQVSQLRLVTTHFRAPVGITADISPSACNTDTSILMDGILGDDTADAKYCGWNQSITPTLTLDFGSNQTISKIELFAFADVPASTGIPGTVSISYQKTDGSWSNPISLTTTQLERVCNGRATIERTFAAFNARFVRVTIGGYKPQLRISEIKMSGATGEDNISRVKNTLDGIGVQISDGKAITAALGTSFYIEEDNRTSGIRVISNYAAVVGNKVTVAGYADTRNGEKVIVASDVQPAPGTNFIEPLGVSHKSLVTGLPMTGLLTRIWGKVTEIGPMYYTPTGVTGTAPTKTQYSTDLATLIDGNLGSGQHDTTYCAWGGWTNPDLTFNLGSYRMIDTVTIHGLADGVFGIPYWFQVDVGGTRIMNEGVPGISGPFAITRKFSPISANSVRVYIESWSTGNLALSELLISYGHYATIDDGSGLKLKVDLSYVTSEPELGTYVTLTGVCSSDLPVVIPRTNADVSWIQH